MKIQFYCHMCFDENEGREFHPESTAVHLTPSDTGVYRIQCSVGHDFLCVLQQLHFEVLFEIGVAAINDGYYREAVSSFAASLERFYELYVRIACREREVPPDLYAQTWKSVSAQSERQLGAFLFMYLCNEHETAPQLSQQQLQFRNAVVHKGKIPTADEAIDFGNKVLALVKPILQRIWARDRGLLLHEISQHQLTAIASSNGQIRRGQSAHTTIGYPSSHGDFNDIRDRIAFSELYPAPTGVASGNGA